MSQHLFYCYSDVFGNLTKQHRRDVSRAMKGNSGATTIRMAILFVRTSLTNFGESQSVEDRYNLAWFENGRLAHRLGDLHSFRANEFRFQLRLTVFKKHFDDFSHVGS